MALVCFSYNDHLNLVLGVHTHELTYTLHQRILMLNSFSGPDHLKHYAPLYKFIGHTTYSVSCQKLRYIQVNNGVQPAENPAG